MKETTLSQVSNLKGFIIPVGIYLFLMALVLIFQGYHQSFITLNSYHYNFLNWPMFIITHLGDSLILTSIISIALVRKHPRFIILLIIVVILTGFIGQLMKGVFFEGWDRPFRVFNEDPSVFILPNYRLFHNSFPSGHSITAAAAITALVKCVDMQKIYHVLLAMALILISYSRVYLGVHFPGDVLAGCIIGIGLTLLIIPLVKNFIYPHLKPGKTYVAVMLSISLFSLILGIWLLRNYFVI